jgi:hypothetical protein
MDAKKIWTSVKPIVVIMIGAYLAIQADRMIEKYKAKKAEAAT